MNEIELVLSKIEKSEKVNFINDFVICPITYGLWENEPSFSNSSDMLVNIFENLDITHDYDEQERFVQNNKWMCRMELELEDEDFEDIKVLEVHANTLNKLADRILQEFKKIK